MAPRSLSRLDSGVLLLLLGAGLLSACGPDKAETGEEEENDDSAPESDDDVPPLVSLDAPTDGETVSGDVAWAATASDNVWVSSVSFHVDDRQVGVATTAPYIGTWDSTTVTNGTYTVTAIATDPSGNDAEASASVIVANESGLDPSAIVITSPTEGATVCGEITVETSVSDEVAQVTFSLNDAELELDTNSPFYVDLDTTLVPDGEYTIEAIAADSEGREARDSVTFNVLNDDESCDNAPSILFNTPLEGEWLRGTVEVEVTASDDEGVTSVAFYADSGALATDTTVPFETALATTDFDDGAHTLKAVATDTGGQTSEAEITIYVDNTAPEIAIDSPSEGETLSGTVDVEVTATDNYAIASVLLTVDGEMVGDFTEEPYAVALDTTLLSHGEHVLEAWTTDLAGNEATDTMLVQVDNPPTVIFTDPTDTTVGGNVTITAEATDDDLVLDFSLSLDGEEIASSTTETTLSTTLETCDLTRGDTYTYEASATDTAGSTTTETLTLTVDQPLQVELTEPDGALDYTATLSASVSDDETISSVVFDLDGTTVATTTRAGARSSDCFDCGCVLYNASWSTEAATEGVHTLTVTVTNASGDTATDSATVEIDYDQDDDGYDSEFYGGDDCDDTDSEESPAASEECDGADDDCDGETDEDFDADGDSYLDESACAGLPRAEDCDDTDADIRPGATEDCDGVDDNCDGYTDNSGSYTVSTATFGASSDTLSGSGMAGTVYKASTNAVISSFSAYLNPGSTAVSVTYAIYEATTQTGDYTLVASSTGSISGTTTWYSSGSLDVELTSGYYYLLAVGTSSTLSRSGDRTPSLSTSSGLTAAGYLSSSSAAPTTISTDPSTSQIYYQRISVAVPGSADADTDADGYSTYCGDCDEADATIYPDAAEICDGEDNDCDGSADEDFDADSDGYLVGEDCDGPEDCDDTDPDIRPDGVETCNGVDDDCDDAVDNDAIDGTTYYYDADGDGYGDPSSSDVLCEAASGWVSAGTDCDDDASDVNPGETETCNSLDDDCDDSIDEGFDGDGDGYASCVDCDDADDAVSPAAEELCGDGVDNDCDGVVAAACPYDGSHVVSTAGFKWRGETHADYGGYAVAGGYDADGDGLDDVLISAPQNDDGGYNAGSAYVLYGPVTANGTLGASPSVQLIGEDMEDNAGQSVAFAGDQDKDGYDDLFIGATSADDGGSNAGVGYLVMGPVTAAMDLSGADARLIGVEPDDSAASAVAPAGDVDGDGVSDLLIGARGADTGGYTYNGAVYLVLGPSTASLDLSAADGMVYGNAHYDSVGKPLVGGGDTDGDGYADFALAAPYYSTSDAGRAFVFNGPYSGTSGLSGADSSILGVTDDDYLGGSVGFLDADGDGDDDLVVGATGRDTTAMDAGAVYIHQAPLSTSESASAADATLSGRTASGFFGSTLAVCEIDGDGFADLLVGAPEESTPAEASGAAYVFYGPLTGSVTTAAAGASFTGEDAEDSLGHAAACAGDTDGDGLGDLLLGAYIEDYRTSIASGSAYIIPFAEVP